MPKSMKVTKVTPLMLDRYLGTPGLHSVGGSVAPRTRRSVLPPDLFARAANDAFWRDPARRPEGLRIV